jgi:hypothetical protein
VSHGESVNVARDSEGERREVTMNHYLLSQGPSPKKPLCRHVDETKSLPKAQGYRERLSGDAAASVTKEVPHSALGLGTNGWQIHFLPSWLPLTQYTLTQDFPSFD